MQEGANCPAGETESIVCSLTSGQAVVITGFSMKTTNADGTTSTQALPFSSTFASYYGLNPAGVAHEFTCSVGLSLATVVNKVGGVLAR